MGINKRFGQAIIAFSLIGMVYGDGYGLTHSNDKLVRIRVIQNTHFVYGVSGNMVAKTVNGKKIVYRYNAINQLISVQKPGGEVINLRNTYDALGNMKQSPEGDQYNYNVFGQLIQFQNQSTGIKAKYQYYVNGSRSRKIISSNPMVEPIEYYYDNAENANIVNEKQGQLGISYLLPSGHMVRYIHNGQGNVRKQIAVHGSKDVEAILNAQGKVEKTYHYSPNGIIKPINPQDQIATIMHPKAANFSITSNPFQYSTEYRDLESGLSYLRARYYNPSIQRFIQRDSYQLLNRYAYVNGNPIMAMDPSGHVLRRIDLILKEILEEIRGTDCVVKETFFDDDYQKNAFGITRLKDSSIKTSGRGKYTGTWDRENDRPHGERGAIRYEDGNEYVGRWRDGRKHDNNGRFIWAQDGLEYRGNVKNGQPNGNGQYILQDGTIKYEGDFKDGQMHGKGTMYGPHGDRYEGQFKKDKLHGIGTFFFANGTVYEGQFKYNMAHGKGKFFDGSGNFLYEREYQYNVPCKMSCFRFLSFVGGPMSLLKDDNFPLQYET